MRNENIIDTDYLSLWALTLDGPDYVPDLAVFALEVADMLSMEELGVQCRVEAWFALEQAGRN